MPDIPSALDRKKQRAKQQATPTAPAHTTEQDRVYHGIAKVQRLLQEFLNDAVNGPSMLELSDAILELREANRALAAKSK